MARSLRQFVTSKTALYCAACACAAGLLLYEIREPFTGQHEKTTVLFANGARNMVRYGYLWTKLGLILDSGPLGEEVHYYLHHSPLVPFQMSLLFHVFGPEEWAARLVGVIHALATLVLLIYCMEKWWGRREAALTAVFLVFSPMFAYYGRVSEYSTVASPYLLLALIFYLRWRTAEQWTDFAVMLGSCFCAMLVLEGCAFAVALTAYHWATARRGRKTILILGLLPLAVLALLFCHMLVLVGWDGALTDLGDVWLRRGTTTGEAAGLLATFRKQLGWAPFYFTYVPVVLVCLWGTRFLREFRSSLESPNGYLGIFFASSLLMTVALKGLAYNHEYYWYTSTPAVAGACAVTVIWLWKRMVLSGGRVGAAALCGIALLLFLWNGLRNFREVHDRVFYTKANALAGEIRTTCAPQEGVLTNLRSSCNLETFPFYADRHIVYDVRSMPELDALAAQRPDHYRLKVFVGDHRAKFIDLKSKEYWWLSPPRWTPSKKMPCTE